MKTIAIFLSLINSLLAGVILMANLTGNEIREATFLWLLTKLFVTIIIMAIGVLTWLGSMFTFKPTLMALSSLFLVALGAATVVWTFHLAMTTGDMEYYMVIYGGSLATQGAASLLGFAEEPSTIRTV